MNTPRSNANRAHKLIQTAGTANYWVKRMRELTEGEDSKGAWKNHPEFIQEILDANGEIPPGENWS